VLRSRTSEGEDRGQGEKWSPCPSFAITAAVHALGRTVAAANEQVIGMLGASSAADLRGGKWWPIIGSGSRRNEPAAAASVKTGFSVQRWHVCFDREHE
jgi:hypothetical protein